MVDSTQVPGYDGTRRISGGAKISGTPAPGVDPTNEEGQYPPGSWGNAIFGGTLPDGTGAPGTQGAQPGEAGTDPTNEPGQTEDGLTGISEQQITSTGAPGSPGAEPDLGTGPDSVTFTRPGSFGSGSYAQDTVHDAVSGIEDWTTANPDGYGSAFAGQLPGLKGNEPLAGEGRFQPGGAGRVLRGGRDIRP